MMFSGCFRPVFACFRRAFPLNLSTRSLFIYSRKSSFCSLLPFYVIMSAKLFSRASALLLILLVKILFIEKGCQNSFFVWFLKFPFLCSESIPPRSLALGAAAFLGELVCLPLNYHCFDFFPILP